MSLDQLPDLVHSMATQINIPGTTEQSVRRGRTRSAYSSPPLNKAILKMQSPLSSFLTCTVPLFNLPLLVALMHSHADISPSPFPHTDRHTAVTPDSKPFSTHWSESATWWVRSFRSKISLQLCREPWAPPTLLALSNIRVLRAFQAKRDI